MAASSISWADKVASLANPSSRSDALLDVLHTLNEQGAREPELVVRFGTELIDKYPSKLGDQIWAMRERVVIAALDCHDVATREKQLAILKARFPRSIRYRKLNAMSHEAQGRLDRAMDEYSAILVEDPINQGAMKRKAAIERARGDLPAAARELTGYLKVFSSDEAAWLELADVYTQHAQFELAAFAVEELILIAPENYLYHLQYAELQYTIGGRTEVDTARQYYAQSLELKPTGNLRALLGLMLCLHQQAGRAGPRAALHAELAAHAAKRVTACYAAVKASPSSSPAASSVSQQHVTEAITKI